MGGKRIIGELTCKYCGKTAPRYQNRQETCGERLCRNKQQAETRKKNNPPRMATPWENSQQGRSHRVAAKSTRWG